MVDVALPAAGMGSLKDTLTTMSPEVIRSLRPPSHLYHTQPECPNS